MIKAINSCSEMINQESIFDDEKRKPRYLWNKNSLFLL